MVQFSVDPDRVSLFLRAARETKQRKLYHEAHYPAKPRHSDAHNEQYGHGGGYRVGKRTNLVLKLEHGSNVCNTQHGPQILRRRALMKAAQHPPTDLGHPKNPRAQSPKPRLPAHLQAARLPKPEGSAAVPHAIFSALLALGSRADPNRLSEGAIQSHSFVSGQERDPGATKRPSIRFPVPHRAPRVLPPTIWIR